MNFVTGHGLSHNNRFRRVAGMPSLLLLAIHRDDRTTPIHLGMAMSSCISNEIAEIFFYGIVAIATSVYLLLAARVLANAKAQADDKTIFSGSLLLTVVGGHKAQRRKWAGPDPSPQDNTLRQRTRGKLMWSSLAVCFVGAMLLALFNVQTCWLQNLRLG